MIHNVAVEASEAPCVARGPDNELAQILEAERMVGRAANSDSSPVPGSMRIEPALWTTVPSDDAGIGLNTIRKDVV
ncbi:hypothetical protein [Brevundimonas abyssalis]|nr:hypothetical protein [Brevundimonas abyssalis]